MSGIYKHIEKCTRVAYKSEDKITEDSAASFIDKLLKMKHLAPMEFGTIHFKIPTTLLKTFAEDLIFCNLYNVEWIKCKTVDNYTYFTTNYRHWLELEKKVSYIREYFNSEDNEYYPKRYTVKLITNRAVSHEVVRHRTMSFIQESQRFCAYNKDKFNNEVTFIKPCWLAIKEGTYTEKNYHDNFYTSKNIEYDFMIHLLTAEATYFKLLKEGWKPQQARVVLPNSTKTELYMCGFKEAWEHFFELRDNKIVDPQMYDLAHPMHQDFINNKYL
jgi:thymidylate synthase (FAD)